LGGVGTAAVVAGTGCPDAGCPDAGAGVDVEEGAGAFRHAAAGTRAAASTNTHNGFTE